MSDTPSKPDSVKQGGEYQLFRKPSSSILHKVAQSKKSYDTGNKTEVTYPLNGRTRTTQAFGNNTKIIGTANQQKKTKGDTSSSLLIRCASSQVDHNSVFLSQVLRKKTDGERFNQSSQSNMATMSKSNKS